MKRIRETTEAGGTILVREYDLATVARRKGEARKPKENPSPLAKVRANWRAAVRKLTALMNENCRDGDLHLVFTYCVDMRPSDPEAAKKDFLKNIIPKIRKSYAEAGVAFGYSFYRCEVGKRGGIHHHLVVPRIDALVFRRIWTAAIGNVHYSPLWSGGEYSELAAYFLKSDNPDDPVHYNPQPGRKWSMAKTVKRPKPPKKKELKGSWERKDPYVPKGYLLKPDTMYVGENPWTHRLYRTYILVKGGGGR